MQEAEPMNRKGRKANMVDPEPPKERAVDKVRDRYLKFMRRVAPNRAGRVMLSKTEVKQKIEWSKGVGSIITEIPKIEDPHVETVELYPVLEPYSYARITYNNEISEYFIESLEPQLTEEDDKLLLLIKDTLGRALGYEWTKLTSLDKKEYLVESVESYLTSRGMKVDPLLKKKLNYYILRDFVGYGKVDILMRDENIEDISCDGVGIPLFIYHRKYGSLKTGLVFDDEDALNNYVVALGQRSGKQISVSNPILDGTSPEGHRIQATYAREVTTKGSTFTIRRFKEKPFTPVDLVKSKTASAEMIAYFWLGVENGESMIICGGTASGKTSTLNSLALFIPPGAKIVTMEDTREINLPHMNWIPGTTRSGVGERGPDGKTAGEIDMYDLMRASLRQRPNYIIVGEVRGKETYTMFQAMATGHTTYSTMHADSVQSMVNRLENQPINCPRILLTALRNVIIQSQVRVGQDLTRRMKQVIEIVGFEPDTNELISNTVYEWDQATDRFVFKGHSFLFDKIMEMKNLTNEEMSVEFNRRVDLIKYMVFRDITDHHKIWELINQYLKDEDKTITRVRRELQEGGITVGADISDSFTKFDAKKKDYMKTKRTSEHTEVWGPHLIKLPEGVIPDYIALTPYQMLCWRMMGKAAKMRAKPNPKLEQQLLQAHMRMRPEEYVAYVWMSTFIVFAISTAIAALFGGLLLAFFNVQAALVLFFTVMLIAMPPLLTYVVLMSIPGSKAKTRARDINKRIGAAMSFISAMASADVNIDVIFKELAKQDIYGEIKHEAEWITRDTELLGIDILTAINRAAQRTPSVKFQEFLQGVVTSSTSGGQLKPYFLQKAEQYEKEGKLDMKSQLESLGLMAESFVTVVVAFPLFLVVIMAIMAIVPGGGGDSSMTILLLELVIGLMIPMSQFGFIFFIWNMTKESTV